MPHPARRDCLLWLPAFLLPSFTFAGAAQASLLSSRVDAARNKLAEAITRNDAAGRTALYKPVSVSLPEYQPALHGRKAILAYHTALAQRRSVSKHQFKPVEVLDLGNGTAFETGTFEIAWADGTAESGKYVHVWKNDDDGAVRLRADAWGYFRPLPSPQIFTVDLPNTAPSETEATDATIASKLNDLNRRNADAVRAKDADTQIAFYTDDAIFMPFADTAKTGKAEIASHLRRYIDNGRGAVFDTVEVWNEGFEVFNAYIIEYSRFRVRWRSGDNSGVATGGGIRLWKRLPGGELKMHRQIGTHYHLP